VRRRKDGEFYTVWRVDDRCLQKHGEPDLQFIKNKRKKGDFQFRISSACLLNSHPRDALTAVVAPAARRARLFSAS